MKLLRHQMQAGLQLVRCRPKAGVPYELMFASKTKPAGRLTDAVDLLIDFATLGEYGLEPVGRALEPCEAAPRSHVPQEESFSEALFPNRHRCGPGRSATRGRDDRGTSRALTAAGAA
jgi:hypothetical protein